MAEDIDDLLDEVETKFVRDKSSTKRVTNSKTIRRKQDDEDLDKLIDDICGDPEPLIGRLQEKCNITQSGQVNSRKPQRPLSSKCYPLYIGGSSSSKGLGSSFNKKSCDSIRCTSCDFRVVSFDDFEWDKSTDYLFLRNHVPNFEKLKSKLNSRRGYRAYCCQCSHVSVNILTDVKDLQLKWILAQTSSEMAEDLCDILDPTWMRLASTYNENVTRKL